MKKLFAFLSIQLMVLSVCVAQFTTINVGTTANDGTGDTLRTAFGKVNTNFTTAGMISTVQSNALQAQIYATNAALLLAVNYTNYDNLVTTTNLISAATNGTYKNAFTTNNWIGLIGDTNGLAGNRLSFKNMTAPYTNAIDTLSIQLSSPSGYRTAISAIGTGLQPSIPQQSAFYTTYTGARSIYTEGGIAVLKQINVGTTLYLDSSTTPYTVLHYNGDTFTLGNDDTGFNYAGDYNPTINVSASTDNQLNIKANVLQVSGSITAVGVSSTSTGNSLIGGTFTGTHTGNGSSLTNLVFPAVTFASIVGNVTGNGGMLWNSNKVLYWVTTTKTNLVSDGR